MSNFPRVSVVMPAYNSSKTIGIAIESLLGQTFINWELLIINDGSTDSTLDVIAKFNDIRIRVVTQNNQGVAEARNVGLRLSRGEYIAFLDSDDLWLPEKLQAQLSIFTKSSHKLGLVYTKHRGFLKSPENSFSMDVDASIGYENDYYRLLIMDYIPTLTVMIRASVVREIGYFRGDLQGTEDWDYWIRVSRVYNLLRIDRELALYRIQSNSLSRNKDRHAIEELKVLDAHLASEMSIPISVRHMARLFWQVKKIRHQLGGARFVDAIRSIHALMQIRPLLFKNYCLLFLWIFSYSYQRRIANLFVGKNRLL